MVETRYRGYVQKLFEFSDSKEVERSHTGRYGAPGMNRQKRRKPTPEDIARQNLTNKINRLRRLIKKNFNPNKDYWMTMTYQKGKRTTIEAVKADVSKLMQRIKYQYQKRGYQFKWIIRIGVGERGAAHIHVIINRIPDADVIISEEWSKVPDSGHIDWQLLRLQGDFKDLASYIAKEEEGKSTYSRSRNLEVVEPRRQEIKTLLLLDEPKPYKGYYIDKESIVTGINPVTGYRYQHFTMIKIKERSRGSG